ncbi:hypothetical protein DFJ73DRAFT_843894 [Zopfochytrium polystomum]|nr:hypothetical protein DFJ73DRAFT_843894 [Zopfochytrium polystomum]
MSTQPPSSPSPSPTASLSAPTPADQGMTPFDPSKKPTYADAIKSLKLKDLAPENVARLPCARNALLYGIGTGLGIGTARFLATRRPRTSGNWAILSFAVTAVASWEVCRLQRRVVQEEMIKISPQQPQQQVLQMQSMSELSQERADS